MCTSQDRGSIPRSSTKCSINRDSRKPAARLSLFFINKRSRGKSSAVAIEVTKEELELIKDACVKAVIDELESFKKYIAEMLLSVRTPIER